MRTRAVPLTALVAGLCALAACGGGEDRTSPLPTVEQASSTPSAAAPRPTPTPPMPPILTLGPVTLAFAGDIHFEDEVRARLSDPATALSTVAHTLSAADVAVVNLETAVTERGAPEPKMYTFRVAPAAFDALAAAGVDVVTMANNHAVDYGEVGLQDTLDAIEAAPVPVVGIGADDDQAFAPAVVDVRGTTVAVFGATDVPDRTASAWAAGPGSAGVASAREPGRLLEAVRAATSDIVVVYLHYGEERVACPTSAQQTLAAELAEAGADVVVGAHAHILLGSGWLGPTYVSYGLGNFVWYSPNSVAEATSGVLTLTVRDGVVADDSWTPTFTGQDGLPRVVTGPDGDRAVASWEALRGCTGLAASLEASQPMG
ncbi:MAG: CapA family protein [Jiangellaceae bacterium]